MGWWGWITRRAQVLFRKDAVEAELDEEFQFHLEMEIRQHIQAGVSPEEARRRALVSFGGVERHKERTRDARGGRVLDDAIQDVRVALRTLPKEPAFALAVILTLGLGIAGNVAMFGVMEASVFQALPYPDGDRLVLGRSTMGPRLGPMVSGMDFADFRDRSRTLEDLGAIAPFPQRTTVTGLGDAERADVVTVSWNFFQALGVAPTVGRSFSPDAESGAAQAGVVLSHGYWQRRFGSDPSVIGRAVNLNGSPWTVLGVMPQGFRFLLDTDMWVPFQLGSGWAQSRQQHNFLLVGRLSPGSTLASAQTEVDGIAAALREEYPENEDKGLQLTDLRAWLVETYVPVFTLLIGAVVVLLLVACSNVAGLLLARGNAREAELAVRSAMGAHRPRLVRQLLAENAVLALGAGVVGLLLAVWIQRGILAFVETDRIGTVQPGVSLTTLAFSGGLSVATVLLFGLLPALRLTKTDTASKLRGTRSTGSGSTMRFRNAVVVGQVALSVVLLAVSGLLLRSFQEMASVDLGFDGSALLTAEVQLPAASYTREERVAFMEAFNGQVSTLPGVSSVAMASQLPVRDPGNNMGVWRAEDPDNAVSAYQRVVWPGYFQAMGIPLRAGRAVQREDDDGDARVIVLSETAGEALFGQSDPVGQTVLVESFSGDPVPHRVVGVVGDVIAGDLREGSVATMYFAYPTSTPSRMRLAVRTSSAARTLQGMREALRRLDANVPLDNVVTMRDAVSRAISGSRATASVVTAFGLVALLVTGIGLYGAVAYQVSQRRSEIGIRVALGASGATISGDIVRQGVRLVGVGLLLGIPAGLGSAILARRFFFGVSATDPLTLILVALFTTLVAVAASALPARRAARVPPADVLRA